MKYKQELHNYFDALSVDAPVSVKHQAQLRRALLQVQPVEQSFVTRLRSTLSINGVHSMYKTKHIKSAGFAAVAVVAVLAVTAVTISNSPGARAESLTNKGISSLQKLDTETLSTLTSQFSNDPIEALKEAKDAKDLKIISKSEYEQLKRSSRSVDTRSKVTELPGGGYEMSGSVSGDNIAPGSAGVGSSASAGEPSTNTPAGTYENGVPVASSDVASSDAASAGGTPSQARVPQSVQDRARGFQAEATQNQAKAAKFVSFTNTFGQTVVIAFDASDAPLFKTVFAK
jgi:hypothetical protein